MRKTIEYQSLVGLLTQSLTQFADRPALFVDGVSYSYHELMAPAVKVAQYCSSTFDTGSVAVLADKSIFGYQSIVSAMLSGRSYVPLSAYFPVQRNLDILEQSSSVCLLIDPQCAAKGELLLPFLPANFTVIIMGCCERLQCWQTQWPRLRILLLTSLTTTNSRCDLVDPQATDIAYILFTSGSTGKPKGVAISQANIISYLKKITAFYDFSENDRFSQFFEFTFDLSMHDLLVCWVSGACLYACNRSALLMPLAFAKKHALTVWFSVPSLLISAKQVLKQRYSSCSLPLLRYSLFCGEALPSTLVAEWKQIAPNSDIENLYGPTEATVAFTVYSCLSDRHHPLPQSLAVVPIGHVLPGNKILIVDQAANVIDEAHSQGELCLGGDQIFGGYLQTGTPNLNTFYHLSIASSDCTLWYRTGDVVSRAENGTLFYHGRLDRQVQIRGFRIELQEIEHVLRVLLNGTAVAVIAYPVTAIGEAGGIVAYITNQSVDSKQLLHHCKEKLPDYMIPTVIYSVDTLPLNSNGKVDYRRLFDACSGNGVI